nr:hypothetical protein [uncultured Arsenicibacter sp.]
MEAFIRVIDDNDLTNGEGAFRPTVFLPESVKRMHKGLPVEISVRDEFDQPFMMAITGVKKFDLDNPVELRQWKNITIMLKLPGMEELARQLEVVDPNKEDEDALQRERLEFELRGLILEHEKDQEWLLKVYRRVVGPASGIPVKTLARTLLDRIKLHDPKAKTYGINLFRKGGKWIFDDEDFENQAILDKAIERGIVVKDGKEFRTTGSDGKIFATSEERAIFEIINNKALREYLVARISSDQPTMDEIVIPEVVNEELASLLDEVAVPVVNPDKPKETELDKQEAIATLIARLELAEMLTTEPNGKITIADINQTFDDRNALIELLLKNEALTKQLSFLI